MPQCVFVNFVQCIKVVFWQDDASGGAFRFACVYVSFYLSPIVEPVLAVW